jgi:hypothetical protein
MKSNSVHSLLQGVVVFPLAYSFETQPQEEAYGVSPQITLLISLLTEISHNYPLSVL